MTRNRLGPAIADVSGHGIPAALVMTAFRTLLRTKARGRLAPAKMANAINKFLPDISAEKHFVTVMYAVLDLFSGNLIYVNCGHNPPLLLRTNGDVEWMDQKNIALGVVENIQFDSGQIHPAKGDILALYTDGVVDVTNRDGEIFGPRSLAHTIADRRELSAEQLIDQVIRATQEYCEYNCVQDDQTLVIVRRKN